MNEVIQKVQEMISAPSCCPELKAAGQAYLDAAGTEKEAAAKEALLTEIEEDIISIDDLLAFASSEMAEKAFGDKAGAFLQHAKDIKAAGALYCDCPACAGALAVKELLK